MTQDADPQRSAALPVILQTQLEDATAKLAGNVLLDRGIFRTSPKNF